jgi:hypothetical protein
MTKLENRISKNITDANSSIELARKTWQKEGQEFVDAILEANRHILTGMLTAGAMKDGLRKDGAMSLLINLYSDMRNLMLMAVSGD